MSEPKRASKADLIVRVRYSNPLPPPPFAPKLLHIATTPKRYTNYEFLETIIKEKELSLVLDSELGLPMELGKIRVGDSGDGEYWNGSRSVIAPQTAPPEPSELDSFLLGDTISTLNPGLLTSSSTTTSGAGLGGERKKIEVSWLRRTEYLSSEISNKSGTGGFGTIKPIEKPVIAPTLKSRSELISETFKPILTPLSELRHPTKTKIRALESWEVLPDTELWSSSYNLARFGEDPGEIKIEGKFNPPRIGADHRLPRAIFRPVQIPGEEDRIGYYLPESEETALAYERRRRAGLNSTEPDEGFDFRHVRDYEIATTRTLNREYILSFVDGEPIEQNGQIEGEEGRPTKRSRGAYYAPLLNAQTLRKRRPRRNEDPTIFPDELLEEGTNFWHGIYVTVKPVEEAMGEESLNERNEILSEVTTKSINQVEEVEEEETIEGGEGGEEQMEVEGN